MNSELQQNTQQVKSSRNIAQIAWDILLGIVSYFAILLILDLLSSLFPSLTKTGLQLSIIPLFLLSVFILRHFRFNMRRIVARVVYWMASFGIFVLFVSLPLFSDFIIFSLFTIFPAVIIICVTFAIIYYTEKMILYW